ncbi:hypothetical protein ACFL0T_00390 [Candidatus Omnitrophota bacterium]
MEPQQNKLLIKLLNLPNIFWIIGLVIAICVIVYPNITFVQSPHHVIFSEDGLEVYYPLLDLLRDGIKNFHIIRWNPYIWNGMPLIGNPNMFLSPTVILTLLISSKQNFLYLLELHYLLEIILAGIGLFLLAGYWIENKFYRFAAALMYVSSTSISVLGLFYPMSIQFAVIPWILFFIHRLRDRIRLLDILFTIFFIHIQFTQGTIQFSLYSIYIYFMYGLFVGGSVRSRLRVFVVLSFACFYAVLLSSYFLMPLMDNLRHTGDQLRVGVSMERSVAYNLVPWQYVIRIVLPKIFTSAGVGWWPTWRDGWSTVESFTTYQGLLAAVTIVYGLLFLGRRLKFWRLMYLFIVVATTTTIGIRLLYFLNLKSGVPYGRINNLIILPGAIICFAILEKIVSSRKLLNGYICVMLIFLVSIVLFSFPSVTKSFVSSVHARADMIDKAEPFFEKNFPILRGVAVRGIVILLVGLLLLFAIKIKPKWTSVFIGVLIVINFVDLTDINNQFRFWKKTFCRGINYKELSVAIEHPAEILLKDGDLSKYRIHHLSGLEEFRSSRKLICEGAEAKDNIFRLGPDGNMLGRLPIVTGYSSLVPNNNLLYAMFFRRNGLFFRAAPSGPMISQGFLNLFSIKYLIFSAKEPGGFIRGYMNNYKNNYKEIYADEKIAVLEVEDVAPRFYFPSSIVYKQNVNDLLNTLIVDTYDPRKTSYLVNENRTREENRKVTFKAIDNERISINRDTPDLIELKVNSDSRRVLGTTNTWHSWWRCTINGDPVDIFRVNLLFSGVIIPEGESIIRFYCDPKSFKVGLIISIISWLLFIAGIVVVGRKAFRHKSKEIKQER